MNSDDLRYKLYLGVDNHLDLHVATLINELGQVVKSKAFSANLSSYRELLAWCKSYGFLQKSGIEGTGSYGAELTKFLIKNAIDVYEVMRPNRMERRLKGKQTVWIQRMRLEAYYLVRLKLFLKAIQGPLNHCEAYS
ncbi:IS110 family transposase [Vibrio parahaemolyticus]|uniref:IS110 family transposase n=1 Tax=Vibrio parahaemolyticus TaxID=670 RepID=UPI00235FF104|nr:transposase [Vibrio parahaemolyticus]